MSRGKPNPPGRPAPKHAPSALRILTDLVGEVSVDGRGRVVLQPKVKGGGPALADLLRATMAPVPRKSERPLMEQRLMADLLDTARVET